MSKRPRSLGWRYSRTAERYIEQLLALAKAVPAGTPPSKVDVDDAKVLTEQEQQVDGVLTSPPYPGVFNYVADDGCARGLAAHVLQQQLQQPPDSVGVAGPAGPAGSLEARTRQEIGSQRQLQAGADAGAAAGGADIDNVFARGWQADTEAWLLSCSTRLRPNGRIAMLIGDNAGIDALESITAAADAVSATMVARNAAYQLRVIASATVAEDSRRPWGAAKKRNYRREHTILLEKQHQRVGPAMEGEPHVVLE